MVSVAMVSVTLHGECGHGECCHVVSIVIVGIVESVDAPRRDDPSPRACDGLVALIAVALHVLLVGPLHLFLAVAFGARDVPATVGNRQVAKVGPCLLAVRRPLLELGARHALQHGQCSA